MPNQTSDIEWLTNGSGRERLDLLTADPPEPSELVALTGRLRKEFSAARTHLLLEQLRLRERGLAKFADARSLFFTDVGLQQSTDAAVARYKTERFRQQLADVSSDAPILDLCCGIGGDLMALAELGRPTVGVDRDRLVVQFAAANCRARGFDPPRVRVEEADVTQYEIPPDCWWHLDPDRRPVGRRTTRVELHEPSAQWIETLIDRAPNGALKLAPAADVPPEWREGTELEWIGRARQCRQLVVWFGGLALAPGQRAATVVTTPVDSIDPVSAARIVGHSDRPERLATEVGRFIFDPDPTVLAADLLGTLADRYALSAVDRQSGYLTGDEPVAAGPLLQQFEVEEVMPFDRKQLRRLINSREVGHLELKKRGITDDLVQLRKELRPKGKNSATILLTPVDGRATAIVARRCE